MKTFAVNALFLVPSQVGGTETYLRRTLSAMPQLLEPDERLVVFANAENANILADDLIGAQRTEIVRTGLRASSRARRVVFENFEFPRALRKFRASAVWNPGNAAPTLTPCPQVTTIHDMQYKRFPEDFPLAALFAMRVLVPSAVRHSAAVIAVSEFSKQEILRFVPGISPNRVTVTLEAADPLFSLDPNRLAILLSGQDVSPSASELTNGSEALNARANAICGNSKGTPLILVVSNSYPHKSLETAVRAFSLISDTIPHRLVVVGRPRRGEPALQAAWNSIPDKSRAVRLEYANRLDLAALYSTADALVFPSLYEGFGLPVLEAMSAGLPVVAAAEGSIPEVGGDAAVYARGGDPVDFARVLGTLLSDPVERARRAALGRIRASSFSWGKTAAATLSVLRRVASPSLST